MDPQVLKAVYLSSQGRIGRLAYFGYGLAAALVCAVIATILVFLLGVIGGLIALAAYLPMLYLHYNLAAKRFHDLNKPGQYAVYFIAVAVVSGVLARIESLQMVAMLVNLLLLVVGLYLLFAPGTAGANEYGEAPDALPGIKQS
jgi:uncharacterized membrane protein YhaH (DUF805 family)